MTNTHIPIEHEAKIEQGALAIFCLNTSRDYARRIAAHLGIALGEHEEREFEDGEHKSRALTDVRQRDVFVVHSLHGEPGRSVNDKLCRLLFFIGALKDAGAARVTAALPYLCYARKDQRTQPHDPVITRYVAALFEAVGTDGVITVDVHNIAAYENAFRCQTEHLQARPLFVAYFRDIAQRAATVVVAPDFGGAKRAEQFRRDLATASARDIGFALLEKYRSGGTISGAAVVGEVRGKTAIIVDDLISSGATLHRAAQACRAAGALQVYAAATHGLFTAGAARLLSDATLDAIIVTDTVAASADDRNQCGDRLQVIDSSDLLAYAILRRHTGRC